MTGTIILVFVLAVVFLAIVLSLFQKVGKMSDRNITKQLRLLEEKLILEKRIEARK